MGISQRLAYWRRVFSAYAHPTKSQLSFWHERPEANERATYDELGDYYMTFADKADYRGPFDERGIPLLDYRGSLGVQYNPIAIAQYGLGNYNLHSGSDGGMRRKRAVAAADWLVDNLEDNPFGLAVWNHHFDWEYRTKLRAPWFSALAQGQGISMLLRAHRLSNEEPYLRAAERAFQSFLYDIDEGGVTHTDERGHVWLEEYMVDPPTHILNGFVWAMWGVYDYQLATGDAAAKDLFERCVDTLRQNLHLYDIGFWSLYEQSGTRLKMIASPFYHSLHIVQLDVLYRMTAQDDFRRTSERWREYQESRLNKGRALTHKALFKLLYY